MRFPEQVEARCARQVPRVRPALDLNEWRSPSVQAGWAWERAQAEHAQREAEGRCIIVDFYYKSRAAPPPGGVYAFVHLG